MKRERDDLVNVTVSGTKPAAPLSRRKAMQWVMAAAAATAAPSAELWAQEAGKKVPPQEQAAKVPDPTTSVGYGTDPKLVKSYKPGELWSLTFTTDQKATATALADVIIPKDKLGSAASESRRASSTAELEVNRTKLPPWLHYADRASAGSKPAAGP